MRRTKKRLWLLGVGTVLLAMVTSLILISQQRSAATVPDNALPQPGGDRTARGAYALIVQWAESWAEDATLVNVSASMVKEENQGGLWSFLVYSAKQGKLAVIAVRGAELIILREQAALYPQNSIDLGRWKLDSNEIISQWWQERGQTIWSAPTAQSLHVRLGVGRTGIPCWQITVLDTEGDLLAFWEAQADTGERVSDRVQGEQQ